MAGLTPMPDGMLSVIHSPNRQDNFLTICPFSDLQNLAQMGQILGRYQRKEWRRKQVRKIADEVFERFRTQTGCPNLTFEDLYIAVLLIYTDINKHSPGPHFDPPSKEQVKTMMEECDMNLDGTLDHVEFSKFIERLTVDTFRVVSRGLILTLVVAPSFALVTKKATEGIPGIGKVVHKLPNSVYASLVALAVVMFQNSDLDSCYKSRLRIFSQHRRRNNGKGECIYCI